MASGRTEYLNDPEAPRPNSLVPAVGPDGRALLQRRRDTGQWAIPMGKQEIGETVTQCAQRETREETGVTVKITGLPGGCSFLTPLRAMPGRECLVLLNAACGGVRGWRGS